MDGLLRELTRLTAPARRGVARTRAAKVDQQTPTTDATEADDVGSS